MKHTVKTAAFLAAISLSLAISSCSSMLASLSESISQLNDQLASNLSSNPQSAQPQVTTKAASAQTAKPATSAPAPAAKPSASSAFVGTPYTELPAGTDGSVGKSGKYVLFGDWPQTIKAENVTVNESKYVVVGAHTYYKGSDGCWYIKIMENKSSGYEGPKGFRYSDGTRVQTQYKKSYRYFKVEPIKWRILTSNYNGTGKKLLLAEAALTCESFNDTWGDYAMFEGVDGKQYYFTLDVTLRKLKDGSYIQHNNYEHSRIRAFLNGIAYLQGDENAYVKGTPPVTKTNEEFVARASSRPLSRRKPRARSPSPPWRTATARIPALLSSRNSPRWMPKSTKERSITRREKTTSVPISPSSPATTPRTRCSCSRPQTSSARTMVS